MADPLSILGAAAAASQFVEQGAKVIKFACEIYSRFQSPETTQKQLAQVKQLVDLATLIKQNPTLQTPSIVASLRTCNRCIQELQQILEKIAVGVSDSKWKRLRKSFEAVLKEKGVIELFANLEREKSSLVLCIAEIDSSLLHSIGVDVKSMTETLGSVAGEVTDVKTMILAIHGRVVDPSSTPDDNGKTFFEVPNGRVRHFIGREDVLERIEKGFSSGAGPRVVVLRGLGGQGKTQVALEYCRRARSHGVPAIFWIDANSESTVKQSFQAIAGRIKNSTTTISEKVAVKLILVEFRDWAEPWLMVFDNYDDVKNFDNIRQYLPEGEQGCILVTTRNTASDELADDPENVIELHGLAEYEATDLLLKQCRAKQVSETELGDAKAIVQRLVYHALAITQAGSYIRQQKIRLDQFLEHYDAKLDRVLKHTPQLSQYRRSLNTAERETSLNVFTTWELSFQQLTEIESGKLKGDLLTLFAFFDCNDISEQLFNAYCKRAQILKNHSWPVACLTICLGGKYPDGQKLGGWNPNELVLDGKKEWSTDHFVEVLKDLAQLSLLQSWWRGVDNYCHFSLHPLVKDWIRLRIDEETWRYYFLIAAKVLRAAISDGDRDRHTTHPPPFQQTLFSNIKVHEDDRGHLETMSLVSQKYLQQKRLDIPEEHLGEFLLQCGRHKESLVINERVLKVRETNLGVNDLKTLVAMDNAAINYYCVGNLELAETLIRKAFNLKHALLGPEHEETLISLCELATTLNFAGKFEEAQVLAETAREGRTKLLGADHPDTILCSSALARALYGQERWAEADELYRRLLLSQERVLGPQHKGTLHTMHHLGRMYAQQRRFDEAEAMMRRTIEGEQKRFGPDYPGLPINFYELAMVLKQQGRLEDAEELLRRSLTGSEKALGRESSSYLATAWALAGVLKKQKKWDLAEEMMKRTIAGQEKTFGLDHNSTLISLMGLAELLNGRGKYGEALLLYERALPSAESRWGKESLTVARHSEKYSDLVERLKANPETQSSL